jgi:hypothetical protein
MANKYMKECPTFLVTKEKANQSDSEIPSPPGQIGYQSRQWTTNAGEDVGWGYRNL